VNRLNQVDVMVAQTSKSAVSQVFKPANLENSIRLKYFTFSRFGNRRHSRFRNLRYEALFEGFFPDRGQASWNQPLT
jgi:hypothetical protein